MKVHYSILLSLTAAYGTEPFIHIGNSYEDNWTTTVRCDQTIHKVRGRKIFNVDRGEVSKEGGEAHTGSSSGTVPISYYHQNGQPHPPLPAHVAEIVKNSRAEAERPRAEAERPRAEAGIPIVVAHASSLMVNR